MFRNKSILVTTIIGLSALVLASCSSPGPVVLSLQSSQVNSGFNRASPSFEQNTADASLAYSEDVTYSVLNDLPNLGATGTAWSVSPSTSNKATLKKLALGLGVSGDIVQHSNNSFSIGQDDKTGVGLWLYVDVSSAWWNYSSGSVGGGSASSPPCAPDATSTTCASAGPWIVAPTPPANLPDEATAIARVTQLLKDSGLSVNAYSLTAVKSEWSTDVVGVMKAGDLSSNISVTASFGANGVITYASGPLIELKDAGSYPLIAPKDAVKRLSHLQYGLMGSTARLAIDTAVSSPATNNSTPTTVDVPITGARLALMQVTMTNNSSILLPAYTFTNANGDVGTVLAVEDKYLSYGDSPVTDGSDSIPAPTPVPVDPGSSGGSPGAVPASTVTPPKPVVAPNKASIQKLIGLPEAEAQKVATSLGWKVRIAMRDGTEFILTSDYQTNRVNLAVTKGLVAAVVVG
ncbi:MAG: hypothetical protein WCP83_02020 [Actinomycetota bacterium]